MEDQELNSVERSFDGYKYWLLFQKTRVPFPAPTLSVTRFRGLIASSGRGGDQTHMWCTEIYAGKTPTHVRQKE